jgi:FkbM family methyltransferase
VKTTIKYFLQRILGFRNYLYFFSLFIIWKLKWDKNEKDFLHFLKLLPPKGAVLDIGANIGVMSYYLAKNRPERQVLAFEPIPYNSDNLVKIKRKFALNNITLFTCALGDTDGTVAMVLPVENSVRFHGLAHVQHETISEKNHGEIFHCPVHRLDSIDELNKPNIEIVGIKIDVENFEYFALKGGSALIKKHKPIIYSELWDNENRIKTINLLTQLGYTIQVIENNELTIWQPEKHATQNFFFIPK